MGLWAIAGSWCGDNLTDGFVPATVLARWTPKAKLYAKRLVDAGLWLPCVQGGEPGFVFHEWSEQQMTKEEVQARRAKRRAAGAAGGLASAQARAAASAQASATANGQQSSTPSSPVQSRPALVTSLSHLSSVEGWISQTDIGRISQELRCPASHAEKVARDVLSKAKTVTEPTGYILKAIRAADGGKFQYVEPLPQWPKDGRGVLSGGDAYRMPS